MKKPTTTDPWAPERIEQTLAVRQYTCDDCGVTFETDSVFCVEPGETLCDGCIEAMLNATFVKTEDGDMSALVPH